MRRLFLTIPLLVYACAHDQGPTAPDADLSPTSAMAPAAAKIRTGAGGPYAVGFTTFMLHDESRGDRPIPVYVWYPADRAGIDASSPEAMYPLDPFHPGEFPDAPSSAFEAHGLEGAYQEPGPAQGPSPLVMYSPGWQGTAYTDGHFIGAGLARRGFVVAATTHWGDQATVHPDEPLDHLALAMYNRPRDVSFAHRRGPILAQSGRREIQHFQRLPH